MLRSVLLPSAACLVFAATAAAQTADTTAALPAPPRDASAAARPRAPRPPRARRSTEITRAEIDSVRVSDALQLILRLRPGWLNRVPTNPELASSSLVAVYYNGNLAGGTEALRRFDPSQITSIRFLTRTEATMRFGPDAGGGAIVITGL